MIFKKVRQHFDAHLKNKLQENITYRRIFSNLKIEKLKTSLLAVKRIGEKIEIKGTVHRKVGSGQPRATTTKDGYRLKMTVLKENFCLPLKTFFSISFL